MPKGSHSRTIYMFNVKQEKVKYSGKAFLYITYNILIYNCKIDILE